MRRNKGNLFVVSAPSGAGKTTLCQMLGQTMQNIRHSVSYTTRQPRAGEVNDRDYTFLGEAEFKRMVDDGGFAEWAVVHGNIYGTSRKRLDAMLSNGIDVILDIDVQGAAKIKEVYENGIFIFILPPSMEALRRRLASRMSNSEDEIRMRMQKARAEIREYKNYDYVIVNDIFDDALHGLEAIVAAGRARTGNLDREWVEKNFLEED
ncbi:MAG: guanylate kinase [Thermodesulfovibrionales bacterium]|nr:guanylate kinase [Thermodesulfovibrionales bacterium]